MGTPATPASPAATPAKNKPERVELSVWGVKLEIPVPRPALYGIAIALVLGASVFFLSKYFVVLQKKAWADVTNDATAYAQLLPNTELAEFPKHWGETPKWTFPSPGAVPANLHADLVPPGVKLEYFASDGCLLVTRESAGRPPTKHWVLDLSKVQIPPPPAPTGGVKTSALPVHTLSKALLAGLEPSLLPPNSRQVDGSKSLNGQADDRTPSQFLVAADRDLELKPVQGGRCVNPHPGPFNQWYGQVNGCFVQVWRQWPDGCTHFQWFNRCYNYFDPNITWTSCVH